MPSVTVHPAFGRGTAFAAGAAVSAAGVPPDAGLSGLRLQAAAAATANETRTISERVRVGIGVSYRNRLLGIAGLQARGDGIPASVDALSYCNAIGSYESVCRMAKTDVWQGTLALMVLKTLETL